MDATERVIWEYRFRMYRDHELERVVRQGFETAELARAEIQRRAKQ